MSVSADPVRTLLTDHRELCEHAVDPLEIAACLEAEGATDRTAARFRHRDVFSLAEELYARVPRGATDPVEAGGPRAVAPRRARDVVARALLPLLPALLCAGTLAALLVGPVARPAWEQPLGLAVLGCGAAGTLLAARLALCRRTPTGVAGVAAALLLALTLAGERLLREVAPHLPATSGTDPAATAAAGALTLAVAAAPAAWVADWFARRARLRLAGSRSLRAFASGVRPLLALAVAGVAGALLAAHVTVARLLPGAPPVRPAAAAATAGLGLLLFTALLLVAHGFRRAAAAGLGAACAVQLLALSTLSAAWLPGSAWAGLPAQTLVTAHGPAGVPALACAVAWLGLLAHAGRVLSRASAHRHPDTPDTAALTGTRNGTRRQQ